MILKMILKLHGPSDTDSAAPSQAAARSARRRFPASPLRATPTPAPMPPPPAESPAPHLAADLAPDLYRRLAPLTSSTSPRPAPLAVSADAIRHWCEAFEDRHPPYLDRACARRLGFRDCIAPLGAVLSTFAIPFAWPPRAADDAPPRHLHHDVKAILGCPAAIVTAVSVDQPGALVVGDRATVCQRLLGVSAATRTALGAGRFWTIERLHLAPDGALAVRETMTSFGFDPATRSDEPARRTGARPGAETGEPIPPLRMPITPVRAALVASATRDFNPLHLDPDSARRAGFAAPFMSREFHLGIACRFLTDHGGAAAQVRRLELALRRPLCVGDAMSVQGHRRRTGTGRSEVALTIAAAHGVVSAGNGVVARPRPPA